MRQGTLWEDRVIGLIGLIGTIVLIVLLTYEYGFQEGKDSVPACKPKIVRGEYSTEELHRMWRARKRMEAVK